MTYPIAPDDAERVEFLRGLSILDSAPDASLDRIVELCTLVFGVPMSNVSLVDADRQWFKAEVGLGVCETSRDVAFCNYTIMGDEIFEVCDARNDPRFKDNDLVTGSPYIQYYAGAPLVLDGVHIGALCLIGDEPRPPLTDSQREVLVILAELVVHLIRTNRLMRQALGQLASPR